MMNLFASMAGPRAACLIALCVALAPTQVAWAQSSTPGSNTSPLTSTTSPAAAVSAPASSAAIDCPPASRPLSNSQVADGLQRATDHGFLWRITKSGRISYLYGTIHAAKLDWVFPGPSVLEAVAASDTVALELDVLDPDIRKRLADAAKAGADEALPAPLAARMQARMAAECIDATALTGISPEMQIAYLTLLSARRNGIDPAYAIDANLAALGRYVKKPVVSLETPESQIKVLQSGTPAERQAFVETGLADLESGSAGPILTRIATVWALADWKSLSSYKQWCECQRTPAERALMKRLLDDRNVPLAARIDVLHAGGKRVFAAVGVLHMVGPNGLPALMKKRGYKIEEGDFAR